MPDATAAPTRRACLRRLGGLGVVALWPLSARANAPDEVRQAWPEARLQGAGTLRAWGFDIAEVRLWSAAEVDPRDYTRSPFALELQYQRALSGVRIAERSIDEMARIGPLDGTRRAQWLAQMSTLFPDVRRGDRLTGLMPEPARARFAFNGRPLGEIAETGFAPRFFGIWLHERSSEPALRARLLGLS